MAHARPAEPVVALGLPFAGLLVLCLGSSLRSCFGLVLCLGSSLRSKLRSSLCSKLRSKLGSSLRSSLCSCFALVLCGGVTGDVSAADGSEPPLGTAPASENGHPGEFLRWEAGYVDTTVTEFGDSLNVRLDASWIDAASVDARWVDVGTQEESASLARGVDFLLDPRRGGFRLLAPPRAGAHLRIRFRSFPLGFPTTFVLHRPWFPADSAGVVSPADSPRGGPRGSGRSDPLDESRLEIAGSKTFSVQVGSQQDLSLQQSLDLAIHGRIGRNVTVRAVLTDRDTPLQPEGTSAQLQDLDRVLVEVEGPRARMRLGDFETALRPTPFTDFRRQLAGVEGAVDTGPVRLHAIGATSPGTFRSLEFLGVEGVHRRDEVERVITGLSDPIVAGSETVWLDGRRLSRGEDSDYIVDYALGQLTFTSRNPITAYSRIAVDFQLADRPYEGRVYQGGIESGPVALLDGLGLPGEETTVRSPAGGAYSGRSVPPGRAEPTGPAASPGAAPAPGPAGAGSAPGPAGAGSAPVDVGAGSAPVDVGAGSAPGPAGAGSAPVDVGAGSAPGPAGAGSAPVDVGAGSAPGDGGKGPRADRLRTALSFDWLVERDAENEPIRIDLTDEEKAILREAGDQTDSLAQGVRFVGDGNGDYESVSVDTLASSFFVFRGPGGGDFLVRFVEVGPGEGDYVDSTFVDSTQTPMSFFVFVGRNEGSFLPARELVAPESRTLFALRSVTTWGDRAHLVADAALSSYDRNTLSPKDDGDNVGAAVQLASGWDLLPRGPTELGIDVTFRNVDQRFEPVGRLEESFFGLDWNLDPERLQAGDRRVSAATRLRHGRQALRVEVGRLDNTADFRSERIVVEGFTAWRTLQFDARVLRAKSEDDLVPTGGDGARARDHASVRWGGTWVASQLTYAGERTETGAGAARVGTSFHEVLGRLGTGSRFSVVRGLVEYTERRTHDLTGPGDSPRDTGRTTRGELEWRGGASRSATVGYTRRTLTPAGGGEGRTSELGTVRWLLRDGEGLWRQEGRWELSTQEDRERIRVLEFVGEGQGHYDSVGVYQGVGDYQVLIRRSDDPVRRNRIDWSSRTELDRGRGSGDDAPTSLLRQAWREIRVVHYWTAGVETGRPASFLWERMAPVLWGAEPLERVDVVQRADLTTLDGARFFAPRLGLVFRRSQSGADAGFSERVSSRALTLRLRSRPAERWSADVEGELHRDRRGYSASGGESETGWNTRGILAEQSLRLRKGLALDIDTGYRRRDRVESAESADVYRGSPSLVFTPQPRSRVELKTERTSVVRRGAIGRASRELERSGWDSRLLSTVRLREALDLTFFLREARPDGGRATRDLRLELRATF